MSKVIGVATDDGVQWHAANPTGGDYDTLCGLDANDPVIGHHGTQTAQRGQKITCPQCYSLWRGVTSMRLREDSFKII